MDDALAARTAGVPFMAILPKGTYGYRQRAVQFRELGAVALLGRATDVNVLLKYQYAVAALGSTSWGDTN